MVRVWNRCRCTMYGWSHDGGNGLWNGAGDKTKQSLTTKKRLKLTFPKENLLFVTCDDSYLLFSILVCSLSGRFLTRPTRQLALHSDFLRYIVLQTLIYIIKREITCFPSSMLPRLLKSSKRLTDWSIYILARKHQRKLCYLMLLASVIQWSV